MYFIAQCSYTAHTTVFYFLLFSAFTIVPIRARVCLVNQSVKGIRKAQLFCQKYLQRGKGWTLGRSLPV